MDIKLFFQNWQSKIFGFLKRLMWLLIVLGSLTAGYFLKGAVENFQKENISCKNMSLKQLETTSVAINERGELMIIDRNTGTFVTYNDTIAKLIFDMYSSKIYFASRASNPIQEKTK